MTSQALGLIETVGLPVAIAAADAAVKAANVTLVGYEKTKGGGLVVVKLRGDVGAVKAAVEAAVAAASRVGKVYAHHVIARPHGDTELVIDQVDRGPAAGAKAPPSTVPEAVLEATAEAEALLDAVEAEAVAQVAEAETVLAAATHAEAVLDALATEAELAAVAAETLPEALAAEAVLADASDARAELAAVEAEGVDIGLATEVVEAAGTLAALQAVEAGAVGEALAAETALLELDAPEDCCNLCGDPACPRRKGQPHRLCLHSAEPIA